jgi:hypothetical protein
MSRRKYIGIYGATGYAIEQKLLNPWEELPQPMKKNMPHRIYLDLVNKSLLKEHVTPYVVLIINDNLYGLMFILSYICMTCP